METISFCLKTNQIYSSTNLYDYYNRIIDNSQGIIKNSMCDITWRNVNLINLLGKKLINEYSTFNISLVNISHGPRNGTTSETSNVYFSIIMSGLNFISSYDQINNQSINMGSVKMTNGASIGDSVNINSPFFTFNKLSDIIDINIKLILLSSDDYPSYNNVGKMVNHYIFSFIIQPCKSIIYNNIKNDNKPPDHVVKYPF